MDHLTYPTNPCVPALQIPFLCDDLEDYDGLDFHEFPIRKGWATPSNRLQWTSCSDDELACRLQIWLFFGTLSNFCGKVIQKSQFRRQEQGQKLPRLTTEDLPHILHTKVTKSLGKPTGTPERRDISTCLYALAKALRLDELVEQRITPEATSLALVSCSVRTLIQTLISTQDPLTYPTCSWTQDIPLREASRLSPSKAIRYAMLGSGWCPAKVHHLS